MVQQLFWSDKAICGFQIVNTNNPNFSQSTFSSLVVDSGWGRGLFWWLLSTVDVSTLVLTAGNASGDMSNGIYKIRPVKTKITIY